MSKQTLFSSGLLLAVAFSMTGLGVGYYVSANVPSTTDAPRADVRVADLDDTPIRMLPTVHVSARAPIPVLPTVLVRASQAERAAAQRDESLVAADTRGGGSDLPHVHLDMPYYSFGKVLPRISKE